MAETYDFFNKTGHLEEVEIKLMTPLGIYKKG